MRLLLVPLLLFAGLLLFGCSYSYQSPQYDYAANIHNCGSSIRVVTGHLVAGVTIVDLDRTFIFNGWLNGTCFPEVENTDTRIPHQGNGRTYYTGPAPAPIPQSSACNYTKQEIAQDGDNRTMMALFGRCGVQPAQSVEVSDQPFPPYQLNSS